MHIIARSLFATVCLAAWLGPVVPSQAEWKPGQFRERLQNRERVDKNNDGVVTTQEAADSYSGNQSKRVQLFNAFDANHDGVVAEAEYPDAKAFKQADLDHSGTLTTNEFLAAAARGTVKRLDRVDANDDGVFSEEEVQKATEKRWKNRKRLLGNNQ